MARFVVLHVAKYLSISLPDHSPSQTFMNGIIPQIYYSRVVTSFPTISPASPAKCRKLSFATPAFELLDFAADPQRGNTQQLQFH
jgi:hypothetical protein